MTRLFDTVVQNFKSTQKNTQRNLSLGFVFTLLCFFYVVEPFFLHTSHHKETQIALEENAGKLIFMENQLDEVRTVNSETRSALNDIHVRIREYPDHLNQMVLPQIYDAIYGEQIEYRQELYTVQQMQQQVQIASDKDVIRIPAHISDFTDAVNWYVQNWFNKLIDDLDNYVVVPIRRLERIEDDKKIEELERYTNEAISKVNQHLETIDPEFWHTYHEGKVETTGLLQDVIDQSFEPVTALLDELHETISGDINELQEAVKELNKSSEQLEGNLSLLDDRIRSMSSPFGPLPLRATELITLFPILLVLLMIFTALSLSKSSRLYSELWGRYNSEKKGSAREFQFLTDCWYLPPYRSLLQPAMLYIYAITITGIFLYSCYLIWSEPVLFRFPGIGEETFRRALFLSGYATGLLVMILSAWYGYRKLNEVPER